MPGGVPGAVRPYHCEGSLHAEGGFPWGFSSTAGKGPQLSATVIDTPGAPDQRAPRPRSSLVDLWPRVRGGEAFGCSGASLLAIDSPNASPLPLRTVAPWWGSLLSAWVSRREIAGRDGVQLRVWIASPSAVGAHGRRCRAVFPAPCAPTIAKGPSMLRFAALGSQLGSPVRRGSIDRSPITLLARERGVRGGGWGAGAPAGSPERWRRKKPRLRSQILRGRTPSVSKREDRPWPTWPGCVISFIRMSCMRGFGVRDYIYPRGACRPMPDGAPGAE